MKGFYSPIDKLAAELPRTKGTGAEFMTELSKRPGYKPQEAQDRDLQTLMALPKMAREEFLAKLKAKPAPKLEETTLADSILRNPGLNVDPDSPPQYDVHTLPGGTNYREILMRMPHDEKRAKEFRDPASGHWDVPGVLAHVRAKDRVGPNGEKLLHIEEVQSDWHQQGRDKGYATPEALQELRAAELRHQKLKQQLDQAKASAEYAEHSLSRKEPLFQQPDVRARFDATRIRHNNEIMDLMPQVLKAQAEVQDIGHKLNNVVPNAPFKKNWHELALKKMIHHAAEQGYHGIVITPGQEQADRYQLSKHIGMVSYHPEEQRFQAFKPNRETVINEKGATPERVAELIGKEAAERLMKAPKAGDHHYLEGENLNIGGEGMKGFYDKIVPSFLNQFGKKYGAQVGTMHTPIEAGIEPGWVTKPAAPRNVALHHFPITPEMREDVTKHGVPLYADGGVVHMSEGGSDEDYRGSHKAPGPDYGAPLHDVSSSGMYPADFYGPNGRRYYANEGWDFDNDAYNKITRFKGKPNEMAAIHRAIPTSVYTEALKKDAPLKHMIRKGDWVAINKEYAKAHGDSVFGKLNKDYKIASMRVPAKHVWTNADSIHEWGYHPEESKAQGGAVKPVGYTKEKVTVSPSLDQMQYELISVKHSKKVK